MVALATFEEFGMCRFYYLNNIYPASGGRRLIVTPGWLKRLCVRYRVGRSHDVPVQEARREGIVNPSAPGFRAFSGAARRLS